MIVLDFLISNIDRNFGNFRFVRNYNILSVLSLASIFNTGTSLVHNNLRSDLMLNTFSESNILDISKYFCNINKEQLCLINLFIKMMNINYLWRKKNQ